MAQQTSHHVVELPVSTSGSPLVDVAANQTASNSALTGNSVLNNTLSTDNVTSSQNGHPMINYASDATKPSAGDDAIAGKVGQPAASSASDSTLTAPGDSTDGVQDDISAGDVGQDDKSMADISVDASANSDTDTSRADALERNAGNSHNRTNSMKKPVTFSKVSVTKSFLAKTVASPSMTTSKLGDKSSPALAAAQPLVRPRLVAKTGASLQNVQKARGGSEGAGGPDASKVWNKNQPARPPPQKQFTDEELKQQYGIHLANRLQTDEGGKESKWADIDDDEDDWAPEAVTWTDGTKSTLNVQEALPTPLKDQLKNQLNEIVAVAAPVAEETKPATPTPEAQQPVKPVDAIKPTLTSMKRPEQNMKILRPGAAAVLTKQSGSGAGLASSDKPSLKAKSPAPTPPVKSPWAPVPKVDAFSPVTPPVKQTPPPQAQTQPLATQDARAYEQTSASHPAREIAADTFDRSWREGERGNRELFNSANGRYEPVNDARRMSRPSETGLRKPAVLQRPSHGADTVSTRSGSQPDGQQWSRRRGSSISQGSLPPARQALAANAAESVAESSEAIETAQPHDNEGGPKGLVQQTPWQQQMPPQTDAPAAEPSAPVEDPLKMQERIMREKRELAIKRRKEEEEAEALAKQERLRAKLAALEGAGKSKKEREAEAAAAAAVAATAAAQAKAASEKPVEATTASARATDTPEVSIAAGASSAPVNKPSDATPTAEKSQVGQEALPKVAQKQQPFQKKLAPSIAPTSKQQVTEALLATDHVSKAATRTQTSPRSTARVPYAPVNLPFATSQPSLTAAADRKPQQPFGRSPNLAAESSFSPWPKAAPSSSVWGSAGIGNGTFTNASDFAPLPQLGQTSNLPPPPGMGRSGASARISPPSFPAEERTSSLQQQPNAQAQQAQTSADRGFAATLEGRNDIFANQSRLPPVSGTSGLNRPVHLPGPIGPPSRAQLQHDQNSSRSNVSAWQHLASELPREYRAAVDASNESKKDSKLESVENTFHETFHKTSMDPQGRIGGPRRIETAEFTVHDSSKPLDPWTRAGDNAQRRADGLHSTSYPTQPTQQAPIGPPGSAARSAILPPHLRPKAKFPTAPIEATLEPHNLSPPPPETESHPVHQGDISHPLVKLPPPAPKVRLPPAAAPTPVQPPMYSSAVMMPPRQAPSFAHAAVSKPIVQNEAWQMRFNGLFNRTNVSTETPPSPPKTPPKSLGPALAVTSSSRAFMDDQVQPGRTGATVSLPQSRQRRGEGDGFNEKGGILTKPMTDFFFDEERSFGSRPRVLVPRNARYQHGAASGPSTSYIKNFSLPRPVEAHSKVMLWPGFFYKNPLGYHLRVPGTKLRNKLVQSAEPDAPFVPRNGGKHHRDAHDRGHKVEKPGRDSPASVAAASPSNEDSAPSRKPNGKRGPKPPATPGAAPEKSKVATEQATPAGQEKKTTWARPPRGERRKPSSRPNVAAAAPVAST